MSTSRISFQVDELDRQAIQKAITHRQARFRMNGELVMPDGDGDLGGRLLAEICRGWIEFIEMGKE